MKIDPTCTKASFAADEEEEEEESRNCKTPLSSLLLRRLEEEEEGLGSPRRVVSFVKTFQK